MYISPYFAIPGFNFVFALSINRYAMKHTHDRNDKTQYIFHPAIYFLPQDGMSPNPIVVLHSCLLPL